MKKAIHILRILSFDVVLGALASGFMVVYWFEVEMPTIFWWALPLSVWVIYTADHLFDAYRLKAQAHTPRHLFHHQHFQKILLLWFLGGGVCVAIVPFFIPMDLLVFALVMGVCTAFHFFLVGWVGDRIAWFFLKELGVGAIYTAGVWGAPMVLYPLAFQVVDGVLLLQFFVLAMINLLCFSVYEIETDEKDGHTSFVRAIGKISAKRLIGGLAVLVAFAGVWVLLTRLQDQTVLIEVVYTCMLLVLIWVVWDEKRFGPREAYRIWADAVFIFPSFVFLYHVI